MMYNLSKMNNSNYETLKLTIQSKIYNFEISPPAKKGQLRVFDINFDFEDLQSNRFTLVRFNYFKISTPYAQYAANTDITYLMMP